MKTADRIPAISAAAAMVLTVLAAVASADDVVVLTEENFDKEVGKDRGALVEFYAPWLDSRFCRFFLKKKIFVSLRLMVLSSFSLVGMWRSVFWVNVG